MIMLELFLVFLKIGAVSFGGGYGMISLIREEVVARGWMNEELFLDMIALAESTPGPIAVNMATFVGSTRAGFWGAITATLGVILPSFFVILIIAAFLQNFLKYRYVNAALSGIRPVVVGLILATAITLFLSSVFSLSDLSSVLSFDLPALLIFLILCVIKPLYKRLTKKVLSPIVLIIISAALGIAFYSIR